MDVKDIDLEDLGKIKGTDFLTLGEESSDDEDLFKTMVDLDMLGRDELAQKANIDPEARKSKDVAKFLGVMYTIRKADEMQARGMVGLAEIVKPTKNVIDKTPVPTTPSQPLVPKEVPTVVDLGPKNYIHPCT